jgi:hypothetical protein
MSKNNMLEAMRAPRSVSQDSLKVWVAKEPELTEAQARPLERRAVPDPQVTLQAAFGLGYHPPASRRR